MVLPARSAASKDVGLLVLRQEAAVLRQEAAVLRQQAAVLRQEAAVLRQLNPTPRLD